MRLSPHTAASGPVYTGTSVGLRAEPATARHVPPRGAAAHPEKRGFVLTAQGAVCPCRGRAPRKTRRPKCREANDPGVAFAPELSQTPPPPMGPQAGRQTGLTPRGRALGPQNVTRWYQRDASDIGIKLAGKGDFSAHGKGESGRREEKVHHIKKVLE